MTDIVERLRTLYSNYRGGVANAAADGCDDAADEIERLRHDLARAMENHSADLARLQEAEVLLRGLQTHRPVVECENFDHRKPDQKHDWNKCGPEKRWNETWDRIDTFLARENEREG